MTLFAISISICVAVIWLPLAQTMGVPTKWMVESTTGKTMESHDNRTLYSENGWYNTLSSHAELYKNNVLTYNEYIAYADTLVVDSLTSTAIMKNNIHMYDTVNNIIVGGHYGEVLKNNDYAFITDRAVYTFTLSLKNISWVVV